MGACFRSASPFFATTVQRVGIPFAVGDQAQSLRVAYHGADSVKVSFDVTGAGADNYFSLAGIERAAFVLTSKLALYRTTFCRLDRVLTSRHRWRQHLPKLQHHRTRHPCRD